MQVVEKISSGFFFWRRCSGKNRTNGKFDTRSMSWMKGMDWETIEDKAGI